MSDNKEDMGSNSKDSTLSQFPLRFSLFPNVPPPWCKLFPCFPTSKFTLTTETLPNDHCQELQLTWAAPGGVSTVVLDCVKQAGWELVKVDNAYMYMEILSQPNHNLNLTQLQLELG